MSAVRQVVMDYLGLARNTRSGDNPWTCHFKADIATDSAQVLAAADMQGGVVRFTSFSAGRVVTTDTAANILAVNPWMDIGDSFMIIVSCSAAFAATWAAGAGVTLAGHATTAASSRSFIMVTKTSAAAVTWTVM